MTAHQKMAMPVERRPFDDDRSRPPAWIDARDQDDRDDAGGDEALIEGAHDVAAGAQLDEEHADDRADDAGAADQQRQQHQLSPARGPVKKIEAEQHGGDHGDGEGLEQIGGHAGAVADIVADVVGDDGGVAGIILRDAGFDLADEVGADIGTLGEDAAAETREDRDQRGAEGQADQRFQHGAHFDADVAAGSM